MMMVGHDEGGEGLSIPIPLGGPIYVADLVGPLTRVPLFETCVIQELEVCCFTFTLLFSFSLTYAIAFFM